MLGARRLGLTLIELLIVMTILVLLVGAAIPVMSPSSDDRRIREAARGVNAFITGLQARALQSGRPHGFAMKKLSVETDDPLDNGVCLELYPVEQPAPYAGFSEASRVRLARVSTLATTRIVEFVARADAGLELPMAMPGWGADLLPPGVFQPGDTIVIGGTEYRLLEGSGGNTPLDELGYFNPPTDLLVQIAAEPVDGGAPGSLFVYDAGGQRLANPATQSPPYWTEPLRYQIHRQPVRTSSAPLQLPKGAAIDLRGSGVVDGGQAVFFHKADEGFEDRTDNRSEVVVMFAPEGTVSTLFARLDAAPNDGVNDADVYSQGPVSSSVYLLIGKRDNIPAAVVDFSTFTGTDSELEEAKAEINWLNGDSQWVTIGGQSGTVTVSENAFVNPAAVADSLSAAEAWQWSDEEIRRARELALQKAGVGGR